MMGISEIMFSLFTKKFNRITLSQHQGLSLCYYNTISGVRFMSHCERLLYILLSEIVRAAWILSYRSAADIFPVSG